MALPEPILDDRSYEQLRDELLRRADVYVPEWTDRGPSDPGVTMLELFAFLGENLLFRFNQIPDATRLWLLRLLQSPPRPARPARGLVTFEPASPGAGPAPVVELGTEVRAGAVPFRVEQDVVALPLAGRAAIKATAAQPTDAARVADVDRVLDAIGGLKAGEEPQHYTTEVLAEDPAAPTARPLDATTAVDHCLWIAVHSPSDVGLAALVADDGPLVSATLTVGVALDDDVLTLDDVDPCEGLDHRPLPTRVAAAATAAIVAGCEPGVEVAGAEPPGGRLASVDSTLYWEVTSRVPDLDGAPEYLVVSVVGDTTAGLTRNGVVSLRLPAGRVGEVGLPPMDEDAAGAGARPPRLDDDTGVLFWLRAFPRTGVPEIGRLKWLGLNAAEVEQVAAAPPEFLGTGAGLPFQELALSHPSVIADSVVVEVEENGQWARWEVVNSFAASTQGDRHVTVDAPAGRIRSGDSVRGRTFGFGQRIRSRGYRYGGGRAGNVGAKAISSVPVSGVTVKNPLPTAGGEDPETIGQALERIPGELARHDRAVTAGDFRELASVPGVGRAECLARFHPATRCFEAAGIVSVVVWPTDDPQHPDAPLPSAALLRAVCTQLDSRRLVTTEVYVVPPTYRKIAVSVGLSVKPGFSPAGVRRWAELVLRQYLAPLPPYGPEGRGWPLGRRVHGPELEAAVLQVDGVEFLEELLVGAIDDDGSIDPGTVDLEGWEVPVLAELTVVVGPPPALGDGVPPPPAPTPVPIPVPRDEC